MKLRVPNIYIKNKLYCPNASCSPVHQRSGFMTTGATGHTHDLHRGIPNSTSYHKAIRWPGGMLFLDNTYILHSF